MKIQFKNKIFNWSIIGVVFIIFQLFPQKTFSQIYNVAGTAIPMSTSGCYRLTNTTSQSGAVWNVNLINLFQPFDITLTLNFGNRPGTIGYVPATCGADGMSFVLQALGNGVYGPGGGVGFAGITPSLGVVMDTYTANPTDPTFQHISIHKNGDVLHGNTNELTPYTAAIGLPANLTDGLDHLFRFVWVPTGGYNGTISVYFGNATSLPATPTITYSGNVIGLFGGNPLVYWGVSGSTGGCWNTQYVCMTTISNFVSAADTCVGTPIPFTSSSISGLPITSYAWNFGDGGTSTQQNPTHTYLAPGTYNVTLTIINSGGFTNTKTKPIIIRPLPVIISNDTSICKGDTALLYANGGVSYTWSSGQTTQNISVSPLHDSIFVVLGKSQYGCINRDTSKVIVRNLPIITVSDTNICFGDTANIHAAGGSYYLWNTGGNTPTILVSPLNTTNYCVTVTDSFSCHNDTSLIVTVLPLPIISISNDTAICLGRTIPLTAGGGVSYNWSTGAQTNTINVTPNADSTFYVTVTNSQTCKKDTNVTIEILPLASVTISNDTTICKGQTVTLIASGGADYIWNNGKLTDIINVNPITSTTYTVTVTTSGGCIGFEDVFVEVVNNPNPSFSLPTDTICKGNSTTITAIGADVYLWNTGATTDQISVSPKETTTYSVTFTNETNGVKCTRTAPIKLAVKQCNYFYFPNAFTPNGDGLNDKFGPIGIFDYVEYFELTIYDRLGRIIFVSKDPNIQWDGRVDGEGEPLLGVYTYHVYIQENYGELFDLSGTVTLVK